MAPLLKAARNGCLAGTTGSRGGGASSGLVGFVQPSCAQGLSRRRPSHVSQPPALEGETQVTTQLLPPQEQGFAHGKC